MATSDKKKKIKNRSKKNPPITTKRSASGKKRSLLPWILFVTGVTALCFFPMLKNQFTNWDDELYVIQNSLLRGPDWKGIFTQPVVSNYHPLTIISLAINYELTGLDPSSYLLFNFLLHLVNTALVFYFTWKISDKKIWVATLTALIFGIHPMHVESVAWVSERKDVLYTLFFLLSLLQYWRFLQTGKQLNLWYCFLFFILSLLSKPAAIILPLILLLLDYWKGRPIKLKAIVEKIPFLIVAVVFAILTVQIQSQKAMTSLDVFPVWTRLFFASYSAMIYFFRFFIPYPLSAFHPYPSPDHLGLAVLISPLFIIALLAIGWYQRKNKTVIFGILFFIINLLLVLQLVSIGYTIVSERYTYVPYIGLAFLFSMLLNKYLGTAGNIPVKILVGAALLIFGFLSFQRTNVWENSGTLWTDAIKHSGNAAIPHTNRAYYFFMMADSLKSPEANPSFQKTIETQTNFLFQKVIEDCDIALKNEPGFQKAYETRGLAFLKINRDKEALADGDSLVKQAPDKLIGYSIRGTAYSRLNQFDKAISDFSTGLTINPKDPGLLNKRGAILYNQYQKYPEALADFTKAIEISPEGSYYLNRSRCYFLLGDTLKARQDVQVALQKGVPATAAYRKILNL